MQTCIGKRYKNNCAGSEVMCPEDKKNRLWTPTHGNVTAVFS